MTVTVSRPKIRGKASKWVARGRPLQQKLAEDADKYVAKAQAAAPVYATKLGEYLNWYLPQIESFTNSNIMASGRTYFEKSAAGQNARINNAIATAEKTKDLAPEWQYMKRLGSNAGGYGAYNTTGYPPSGGYGAYNTSGYPPFGMYMSKKGGKVIRI